MKIRNLIIVLSMSYLTALALQNFEQASAVNASNFDLATKTKAIQVEMEANDSYLEEISPTIN